MTDKATELLSQRLPKHVAIIMDGNGRWAKQQNKPRVYGHKNGVKSVRDVIEACAEIGIEYLTLYAFSTENWKRPKLEVRTLMSLLVNSLKKELKTLQDNDIKLSMIGDLSLMPESAQKELIDVMKKTENNQRLTLTLALSYGSRGEIVNVVKKISEKVVKNELQIEEISENIINNHLYTFSLPDVDLMIRTSGEQRISNFLLWQSAYAELYFSKVLWPDFRRNHLFEALKDYQNRERRFGKTSDQIENVNE